MNDQVRVASAGSYGLGEGPVWDAPRRRVLWVDIDAGVVHEGRLDGDQVTPTRSRHFDDTVGAVVCAPGGELLIAGARSLITVTAAGPRFGPELFPATARRRCNDGACDPQGRFLIGTLAQDDARGGETLVRIEPDRSVTVLDDDLTLSNGLAWSPDGTLLYSIDSTPGVVWVRDYAETPGPRREWLRFPGETPDGMCADAEGHLWIAFWGSGQVRRYTPGGVLAGVLDLPVPNPTSVAFVGDDLDLLLITTATNELSPQRLAAHPDSGRLFLARPGVTGLPVPAWAGPEGEPCS